MKLYRIAYDLVVGDTVDLAPRTHHPAVIVTVEHMSDTSQETF